MAVGRREVRDSFRTKDPKVEFLGGMGMDLSGSTEVLAGVQG